MSDDAKQSALDEFDARRTEFMETPLGDSNWGRQTTQFVPGPAAVGFLRESTPVGWDIDPTEFDRSSPGQSGDHFVPDTPVSRDADELIVRLRSGEFTDVNIRVDEFDDDASTYYRGVRSLGRLPRGFLAGCGRRRVGTSPRRPACAPPRVYPGL
jgi:hypothetical protein